ncbi:MAG: HAMP domain-containing histidine kinase [Desulfuromonadales bacterium]|nr:HAMP domain-containing histidine kinase [Desulfuromonadales bacterium]
MTVSLGKRFFIYTGVVLIAVLFLAFAALERNQSRQWETFLQSQNISFARFATPEILKQFRGAFPPSDETQLSYVYDFLGFNRDLILFSIFSPSGKVLFQSAQFPDFIDTVLSESLLSVSGLRLKTPRVSVQTEHLLNKQRVLDLLVPAFGPTGEHILSVRYLVSFDLIDRRLTDMRVQFLKIGVFALLGATLLAAFVARRISRPLAELAVGARAIGQGELATRSAIERNDEIGALARAFNEMAESLCLSRAALTEKNSALYLANEELKQVQSQLIRSERLAAIGQLAAGVSHEIDNPVGIILGYAELLKEDLQGDPQKGADLQAIIDECHRCRRITGGLLSFSRIQSDSREDVDLSVLITDTIASLQPQKLFRNVTFKFDRSASKLPCTVAGDSGRLRQVLVNLFLNAAQAMQGEGSIVLSLAVQSDLLSLTVSDSGPGVEDQFREQIFEPFFSTKASGEGTGLGLSLCRRLVEDHGGELSLEPKAAAGACFKLTLPLAKEKTL